MLTPGATHDLTGAGALLAIRRPAGRLLADRAYHTRELRDRLAARGAEAVIRPTRPASAPTPTTRMPIAAAT